VPPAALPETVLAQGVPAHSASADDQPLRFLLIRTKAGELPWLVRTMARVMAPVEIVQVVGMANALWRLGHERFDSVLLDVDLTDRWVVRRCREQIADIAAVPVLDLADRTEAKPEPVAAAERPRRRREMAADTEPVRPTLRLPWQRRPKRAVDPARAEVA
jgi:hypothetical protein